MLYGNINIASPGSRVGVKYMCKAARIATVDISCAQCAALLAQLAAQAGYRLLNMSVQQHLTRLVTAQLQHSFSHTTVTNSQIHGLWLIVIDGLCSLNFVTIMQMQQGTAQSAKEQSLGCKQSTLMAGAVVSRLQADMIRVAMQYLEKDKTRGAVPRVMQKEAGQVQGGLRYLGQLFKQLQVGSSSSVAAGLDCLVSGICVGMSTCLDAMSSIWF